MRRPCWPRSRGREFSKQPRGIPSLEEAARALDRVLARHLHAQEDSSLPHPRHHALLIGPTGSGKSTLVRAVASRSTVPVAVFDFAQVTDALYRGSDIADCLTSLVKAADYDLLTATFETVQTGEGEGLRQAVVRSGFPASLVARFSNLIRLRAPDPVDLLGMLRHPDGAWSRVAEGAQVESDTQELVARVAASLGLGAWGLSHVLEMIAGLKELTPAVVEEAVRESGLVV